jgi:hypothetical protein
MFDKITRWKGFNCNHTLTTPAITSLLDVPHYKFSAGERSSWHAIWRKILTKAADSSIHAAIEIHDRERADSRFACVTPLPLKVIIFKYRRTGCAANMVTLNRRSRPLHVISTFVFRGVDQLPFCA